MVHNLFEGFLDSEEKYEASERYWEQLVQDVTKSLDQQGQWEDRMPRGYVRWSPAEVDGSPIFDGRSLKLDRGFRIFQQIPSGEDIKIAAWLKSYEEQYSHFPREVLVINLSLSEESAQMARNLLVMWMKPETTVEEMQRFISEHLQPNSRVSPSK